MPSLFRSLTHRPQPTVEQRSVNPLSFDTWVSWFGFNGLDYPFLSGGTLVGDEEKIDPSFSGYVEGIYKRNGVVFACIAARMLAFSEARFQFQRFSGGRPGDLFGTEALKPLETPWPNATTGDLLSRMLLDVDMAGNWFGTARQPVGPGQPRRIKRLRPDWMTIVAGSQSRDPADTEVVGYLYQPGGPGSGDDPVVYLPGQIAHFAPFPDPIAQFRGVSWLTPVLREVLGDGAASSHKVKFFEQGATPNLVVTLGDTNLNPETFAAWVERMEATHSGVANAYKTLYLAAGADAKVIGTDLQKSDFRSVQGAGETRIAAAARVPPVIVGLSEGLQGSSLNAGNYQAAKRSFADGTIRPLWRSASGSLASIIDVPAGSRLWYDDRDVPFLREDQKDEAEIQGVEAQTIRALTDGGFTPDSVIAAVMANDWKLLEHTGQFSVQLQAPGAGSMNGNGVPALTGGE